MLDSLQTAKRGTRGQILCMASEPQCARDLRRMGLREGTIVEVMTNHDPVMIRFDGCCLALSRSALAGVKICHCGQPAASACYRPDCPGAKSQRR
ncbi:MAG: hypothetical protein GC162_08085 [Planctomycetes bacterium]|nr:hypothetical protein [Planctomycetota bacterium]